MDASTVCVFPDDVKIVRTDDGHLLQNLRTGSWAKLARLAGIVCDKAHGHRLSDVADRVGMIYGGKAVTEVLDLIESLCERGLMATAPSQTDTNAIEATEPRRRRVFLSVTDRCNLRCATCYRGDAHRDEVDGRTALSTTMRVAPLKPAEIVVTGGEPTLRPDLPAQLRAAAEVADHVTLATNGTMITPGLARALADTGVKVQVSIESADERLHDSVRGRGSFGAAVRGLACLAEAGVRRIEVVSTMVDPESFEPGSLIDFAGQFGATFHASLFMEVGRGACTDIARRGDPRAFARTMVSYLADMSKSGAIPQDAGFDDVVGIVPRNGCGAGDSVLAVSTDGSAYPCHLMMRPEFRMELDDVVRAANSGSDGPGANGWPDPNVDIIDGCEDCDVRYFCAGGCRAAALEATGSLYGKDPLCEAYRALISSLLWSWDDCSDVPSNLSRARKAIERWA